MSEYDSDSMRMSLRDWRVALRSPPSYRIGSSSLRVNTKFLAAVFSAFIVILLLVYYAFPRTQFTNIPSRVELQPSILPYNATYPLTRPIRANNGVTFRIAVVSDLDTASKSDKDSDVWISYLLKGYLTWKPGRNTVSVQWDSKPIKLKSSLNQGGRGMELSELVVFNGRLLTFDDRTGVVYEVVEDNVVPWVILSNGDGRSPAGFKSEWATVKDGELYVGGLGKEWTTNKGEIINYHPQWIKIVTTSGEVRHENWRDRYVKLRRSVGVDFPGYMIHESAAWSPESSSWTFLPRRCSKQPYRDDTDELMGTNLLLKADPSFSHVSVSHIGEVVPSHGFSSFKYLPGTDDQVIVAIKSEEVKGATATYILAFTIQGKILLPETKIGDVKYEGIEFI